MAWNVIFHPAFEADFSGLPIGVQDELLANACLLSMAGPQLKRPRADTLNGSRYANMKELRFEANNGVWRVAYAFNPERSAVLLAAGDKSGQSERRFYQQLILKADKRFAVHLSELESGRSR